MMRFSPYYLLTLVVLGEPASVADQEARTIRLRYMPGIYLLLGGVPILCGGVAGFVRRPMR